MERMTFKLMLLPERTHSSYAGDVIVLSLFLSHTQVKSQGLMPLRDGSYLQKLSFILEISAWFFYRP
jgi:hypothetical protein